MVSSFGTMLMVVGLVAAALTILGFWIGAHAARDEERLPKRTTAVIPASNFRFEMELASLRDKIRALLDSWISENDIEPNRAEVLSQLIKRVTDVLKQAEGIVRKDGDPLAILPLGADAPLLTTHDLMSLSVTANDQLPKQSGRQSERFTYQVRQWVAPCVEGREPTWEDAIEVTCRDLSTTAISFYLPELPRAKRFIVQLGAGPRRLLMMAKLVRSQTTIVDGFEMHVAGCQFIERMDAEASAAFHDPSLTCAAV